jgi:hypothetical protein
MKKLYYISYQHTAGDNEFYVETLTELSEAIDRLVSDPHVIESSVKVDTKEVAF